MAGWLVARGTVGLCAMQAGVVGRALELTAEYARSREQFGRPIGSFQAVAQRLADAYIDVEAVWLTMWQAAWLLDTRPHDDAEAAAAVATAKFWAADAGHRVAHTAVHVHGGTGIDTSYVLHRYFTAAKRAEFTLGGATAQLLRLGGLLAARGSLSEAGRRVRGGRGGSRTRSATFSSRRRSQLARNVVSTVSRQRWISSAILAQGPISATSSTSAVGTAAIAAFLSPAR